MSDRMRCSRTLYEHPLGARRASGHQGPPADMLGTGRSGAGCCPSWLATLRTERFHGPSRRPYWRDPRRQPPSSTASQRPSGTDRGRVTAPTPRPNPRPASAPRLSSPPRSLGAVVRRRLPPSPCGRAQGEAGFSSTSAATARGHGDRRRRGAYSQPGDVGPRWLRPIGAPRQTRGCRRAGAQPERGGRGSVAWALFVLALQPGHDKWKPGPRRDEVVGIEQNEDYVRQTEKVARVLHRSIFDVNLAKHLAWSTSAPLLVVGNPPWVTSAGLTGFGSINRPERRNLRNLGGLDALTGASNFDIAEYIWIKLIAELADERPTIALLCKRTWPGTSFHTARY